MVGGATGWGWCSRAKATATTAMRPTPPTTALFWLLMPAGTATGATTAAELGGIRPDGRPQPVRPPLRRLQDRFRWRPARPEPGRSCVPDPLRVRTTRYRQHSWQSPAPSPGYPRAVAPSAPAWPRSHRGLPRSLQFEGHPFLQRADQSGDLPPMSAAVVLQQTFAAITVLEKTLSIFLHQLFQLFARCFGCHVATPFQIVRVPLTSAHLTVGGAEVDFGAGSEFDRLPGRDLSPRAVGDRFPRRTGKVGSPRTDGIVRVPGDLSHRASGRLCHQTRHLVLQQAQSGHNDQKLGAYAQPVGIPAGEPRSRGRAASLPAQAGGGALTGGAYVTRRAYATGGRRRRRGISRYRPARQRSRSVAEYCDWARSRAP